MPWIVAASVLFAAAECFIFFVLDGRAAPARLPPLAGAVRACAPAAHLALLFAVLWKLRARPAQLSESAARLCCQALLALCALLCIWQMLRGPQQIGSAVYRPMPVPFVCGLPFAIALFVAFFSKPRGRVAGALVVLCCLAWVLGQAAADIMVASEGGARGTGMVWGWPVIGGLYAWVAWGFAMGMFAAVAAVPAVAASMAWRVWRTSGLEQLRAMAVGAALMALLFQVVNWGGFVWD